MLTDLFTDPDAFFEDVAEGDTGLARPIGVVLLVGVIAALASVPSSQVTSEAFSGGPGPGGSFFLVFGVVGGIVGVLVGFTIYVVLFHAISAAAFGSEGSFSDTLAVTGWGYVPAVFGVLLTAIVSFYVFQGVTPPSNQAQFGQFMSQLMDRPIFLVAWILGIAFLLWQAFLWTLGLEHVRDLTTREAAITVAVPVLLDVLVRVYFQFFFGP